MIGLLRFGKIRVVGRNGRKKMKLGEGLKLELRKKILVMVAVLQVDFELI